MATNKVKRILISIIRQSPTWEPYKCSSWMKYAGVISMLWNIPPQWQGINTTVSVNIERPLTRKDEKIQVTEKICTIWACSCKDATRQNWDKNFTKSLPCRWKRIAKLYHKMIKLKGSWVHGQEEIMAAPLRKGWLFSKITISVLNSTLYLITHENNYIIQ